MNREFYITYFVINAYGADVPDNAIEAAERELQAQLGCPYQVLAAKNAFEDAGGLNAFWRGSTAPDLLHWAQAVQAAADAAYRAEPPPQPSLPGLTPLAAAHVDVIAAARYDYTTAEWLQVFTAHFGMSDYCSSHQEAQAAGHRWLAISPRTCPIAAAEQEIRRWCHEPVRTPSDDCPGTTLPAQRALIPTIRPTNHGAQPCN